MAKLYDSVLFDLDGTLTLPKEGIVNSVHYALTKFGIRENDKEKLTAFIGPSLYDTFIQFYGVSEEESNICVEYFREYYKEKGIYECSIMPCMEGLLKELRAGGIPLYIATAKPTPLAIKVLERYGLIGYFDEITGSNLDGTLTHKYEVIEKALPLVKGHKPVMIGDREHDVEGANKNGIDSIAITFGYGERSVLEQFNPTYIADSVDEIRKILL